MSSAPVVGRLAPSPTGALHLGNARSFLLAWLAARQAGGQVILRIEDIDSPRVKPWAREATLEDLKWLGLDWDLGPDRDLAGQGAELVQTQRLERYQQVLAELRSAGQVYPCTCTRSEVLEAASAPHESMQQALEGPVYPGTCRGLHVGQDPSRDFDPKSDFAYRWAFGPGRMRWTDGVCGLQDALPAQQLGDFVIARSNGLPAYQLAVVVDDHDFGVNQVVRGDDLLASTFRQLSIMQFLDWEAPQYYHVPLMVGPDGRRLAKRHGDTRLSFLRNSGISPEALVGYLAWTLQLIEEPRAASATSLLGSLEWSKLPNQPTIFELAEELPRLQALSRR